jgi:formate/nitrite transporter FocA (FNT family)
MVVRKKANTSTARAAQSGFDKDDIEAIEESKRLATPLIYEVVRREGQEEMARPFMSLLWSGVAAGLSISFSLLAEGILLEHLPDTAWRPLVASMGYTVGFIIVVLGRQQLFTENTITVVLPFLAEPNFTNFRKLVRIWGIVFAANMAGTLFAALFCSFTPVLSPQTTAAMLQISHELMANGWAEMFWKAISAGFLIAAMVWLIPSAEGSRFAVVTLMTYLIAVGGFTHVVAGSVEAFMLALSGQIGWLQVFSGFLLPVVLGNIIGGTALVALIAYAQVAREI